MRLNDFGAGAILIWLIIGMVLATKTDLFRPSPAPVPEGVYGYEDTFPHDDDEKKYMRWPNYDPWCNTYDPPWMCERWRR